MRHTQDESVDTPAPRAVRTSAERDALDAAAVYANTNANANVHTYDRGLESSPQERFIDQLPAARREICHRLVGGLLRGQPEGLPAGAVLSVDEPTLSDDAHETLRAAGVDDLLRRTGPLPDACRFVAHIPFPAAETILSAPIETVHGYDRFRLAGDVDLFADDRVIRAPHPVDVVSLLDREGVFPSSEQADRIADEVAESVANLALARLSETPETPMTRGADGDPTADRASVLDAATELPGADPASAIERLATEGHPFHPCAKIRRGMTPAASLLYAPEFTDEIDVRFAAVDRTRTVEVQTGATLTELLYDRFPGLEAAVERAVPADRSREEYAVVPIHPWQYYHVVPDRYAAQIAAGCVVPVPEYTWPATPLLNLRTVVPHGDESTSDSDPLPHLKLAVDVQLTNAVRTVSPQAVSNGPRVTRLLETIVERESFERLGVLSEPAATCYHAPGGPHPDGEEYDNARNLSALARANPYSHPLVPDDAVPITVSGLLAASPVTERPIVCDVLERFADGTGETRADAATARAFFESYVDVMVPDQLRLLCKYGVALETHPQNAAVVVTDGRPVAALVRDLGGIRVLDDRLARHRLGFEPYPDSDLDASGPRELHTKLYYALFQNQFAELIAVLAEHAALEESDCWDVVRTRCLETFEALRSDGTIPDEWINRDETALFDDPAIHKALTAMRLRGKRHEYVTSRVSNPLSR